MDKVKDNKSDNNPDNMTENKLDNVRADSSDWADLATVAAALEVLPKSISGAGSRHGQNIGDDTIEFRVKGRTIHKKGSGISALYQLK